MTKEELIRDLRMDIDQLYMHEDDADSYAEELREMDEDDENYDYTSGAEDVEREYAHQLHHVIKCDLTQLSELMERKITMEDFTDGEFKS